MQELQGWKRRKGNADDYSLLLHAPSGRYWPVGAAQAAKLTLPSPKQLRRLMNSVFRGLRRSQTQSRPALALDGSSA